MTHLINFQARFAAAVESGQKRQTLRRPRKTPIRPGDTLRLYTGLMHKGARLLREVECVFVEPICFTECGAYGYNVHDFAKADGFKDWWEMRNWFHKQYGLPVSLILIKW